VNRPITGHVKKSGRGAFYILKELRVDEVDQYELGQEIAVDIFQPGDLVDVAGTSKGKGFSGVMKRHGFRGAPASHGTHEHFRHGGSIGAAADPSRTFKGKKMPGHLGNRRVTVQNIEVVEVRPQENLIFLKGAIPGWRNGIVTIRQAKKAPAPSRPAPPQEKKEEAREEVEVKAKAEVKEEAAREVKAEVEDKAEAKVEAEAEEQPKEEIKEGAEEVAAKGAEEEPERKEAEAQGKEEAEEQPQEDVKQEAKEEAEAKAEAKEEAKEEGKKEES